MAQGIMPSALRGDVGLAVSQQSPYYLLTQATNAGRGDCEARGEIYVDRIGYILTS